MIASMTIPADRSKIRTAIATRTRFGTETLPDRLLSRRSVGLVVAAGEAGGA